MKKKYFFITGYILLLLLAGGVLYHLCQMTNQATSSFVIKVDFIGEYSLGGSEWKPLEKRTRISGFGGDLVLRGHFNESFPMILSFYLDHIGVTISADGEILYETGRVDDRIPETDCGSYWSGWVMEEADAEKELEIRLHNPHCYGNAGAYEEFLDSLYLGGDNALADRQEAISRPYRTAGIFVIVVSVALLGMALGYQVQRLPAAGMLWNVGFLSLFMGGYIQLDTLDISLRSELIIFNTCMRQFCMMFAALELVNCSRMILTGMKRKLADCLTAILGAADGILLLLALFDVIAMFDTGLYWAVSQGIISLVLISLCILEFHKETKPDKAMLISCVILLSALSAELLNARMNWWTSGIVIKIVFGMVFLFQLIRAAKQVTVNHRDSMKAKELEGELRNSRIVLAMSQIRTHFIFNVLTAISGMCEYDPRKADETLIRFSRYLRSNIDIMQEDGPESFSKSLKHLEDYVVLEQLRFGDKIQFVKKLEVTDFQIPPLILQPIVENAIKHGLLPKSSGGTIELCTWTDGKNNFITITDDGVGFDTENMTKNGSVGLGNIRFRLLHMVNGSLDMESSPGKGTKVTITIPCQDTGGKG